MKRGLSCLLAIILCFTILPIQAFAVSDNDLYTQYPYYLRNEEYNKIEINTFNICYEIMDSQKGSHEFEAIIATLVDDSESILINNIGAALGIIPTSEEAVREKAVEKLLAAISAENMSENEYTRKIASEAKKWTGVYKSFAKAFKDDEELTSFLTEFLTCLGVESKYAPGLKDLFVKKIPDLFSSQAVTASQTVLSLLSIYGYRLDSVRVIMDSIDKNSDLYKDLKYILDRMMNPIEYINENYTSKAVISAIEKYIKKGLFNELEKKFGIGDASWIVNLCKTLYFTFIYEGYKVDDYAEAVYLLGYETTINSARSQLISKFSNGTATNDDIERYQQLFDLEIIAQIAALHAFAGLLSVYNRYDLKMKAEDQAALLSWNHDYNWYIGQCKKCLEADLSAGKAVKRANNNQAQTAKSGISATSIVSEANALVGKYPYVWGGRSPADGGFDCTGLIYYIYHTRLGYGMTVEQSVSKSKLLAMGTKITNKADLLPGDIIQYTISHVGIYIGNNTVIHAGSSKGVVKIPLNVNGLTFSYGIRLPNIAQDNKTNSDGNNSTSSTPGNNKPSTEKLTATYADCDVEIACVNGQTVNLYSNPGDTSRVTYFSKGQTVRSIYCAKLSDGSTWYRVNADYNGDYRTFWLKYESSKMTVTPITPVHTLHFNANGGSVSTSSKQVTAGGTYGELPTPTRSGYTFDGWYTTASGGTKVTSSTTVNLSSDQITLYAHWSPSTLTVTFNANGGSVSPTEKMISAGSSYGELPTPSNGDLHFEGWYTERSGGTRVRDYSFPITNTNHTLYAQWADIYHATLDPNGGTVQGSTSPIRVDYKSWGYSNFPTATRPGYTFDGWYAKEDGERRENGGWKNYGEDAYFYAHWTPIEESSYVVTFDSLGGDLVKSIEVKKGGTYGELPHAFGPTFGTTFLGWFTEPTGGIRVKEGDPLVVNADHTLYAHYRKDLYKITFDPNGGTVARQFTEDMSKYPQEYYVGAKANGYDGDLPKAAWDGHDFLGWYTAPVGGTQVVKGMSYIVQGDHTLYAHWR